MSTERNPEFTCIVCKKSFSLMGTHEVNKKSRMWCPYCGVILIPHTQLEDKE